MEKLSKFYKDNKVLSLLGAAVAVGSIAFGAYKILSKPRKTVPSTALKDPKYKEEFPLTKVEALYRSSIVDDVKYHLGLLLKSGEEYEGKVVISFKALKKQDTFIDFQGREVSCFTINGCHICTEDAYLNHKLKIPGEILKEDGTLNKAVVHFKNNYRNDSVGLHRFIDPEDNKEYFYTQCEPFCANKIFPCFDQPNLKATLKLVVIAPQEWSIVGNSTAIFKNDVQSAFSANMIEKHGLECLGRPDGSVLTIFAETPRISTYLYALAAGPWYEFEEKVEGYPDMRIMCRQSLKDFIMYKEFFEVTRAGMDYYKDFFGVSYVFDKYDQIFCPEYKFGAMENVGLVTYTEHYVFKDKPSYSKLMRFFCTVLHQLAHMWFGNFVTMEWWDDLWLNESFATYMSHLALAYAKGIRPEWQDSSWDMFLTEKAWGYAEDQLSTTHSISTDVTDTDVAQTHFDGITYAKGSAFLKQLACYIGLDRFEAGVKIYFKRHAWGNTQLKDFLTALDDALRAEGENLNLMEYCDVWLKTSGLNWVKPELQRDDTGSLEELKVRQGSCQFGDKVLRKHKIDIALFDKAWEVQVLKGVLLEDKEEQIISLGNQQDVQAVFLNVNDHGFLKVRIDHESLKAFRNLSMVKDKLTRRMLWQVLWEMVKDFTLSSIEFLELVEANLLKETVDETLLVILARTQSIVQNYLPSELKEQYSQRMLEFGIKLLTYFKDKEDITILLLDRLVFFFQSEAQAPLAIEWLQSGAKDELGTPLSYGTLSNRQKYSLLPYVYSRKSIQLEVKEKLLGDLLSKDKSDMAVRAQIRCRSSLPDPEIKAKEWLKYHDEEVKDSVVNISASMSGFFWDNQRDITGQYIEQWLNGIVPYAKKYERERTEHFHDQMAPVSWLADQGQSAVDRLKALVESAKDIKFLEHRLKEDLDFLILYQKARQMAKEYSMKAKI